MSGSEPQRVYVDNAATTWPKPDCVYEAIDRYQREIGAPAGRGAYAETQEVERTIAQARKRVAELLRAERSDHVVFTANGTEALNLVLHGLPLEGRHVITTVADHNSVLRPLRHLQSQGSVEVQYIDTDDQGYVDPEEIRRAIRPETGLIAVVHASNVTGAIQPVEAIADLASEREIPFLLDAAQTLGHLPIDVRDMPATFVAAPGHKALLGPLGTGVLWVHPDWAARLRPIKQGGTGSQSEQDQQPDGMPDRFESGNLNVAGIYGLAAGARWVAEQAPDHLRAHDQQLTRLLLQGLSEIEGVEVVGPRQDQPRIGVVSLRIPGYDPQEVGGMLDASCRIQVRTGLHCAPLMHRRLNTLDKGGTVRISLGPFNTEAQVSVILDALASLAATAPLS